MKKLFFLLIIFCLPLIAEEIWLGMAMETKGDTLILVDNLKVYVPGLSLGKYINQNNQAIDINRVKFPFTASLVKPDGQGLPDEKTDRNVIANTYIKIHKFYRVVNGRLVEEKE
ncbi:MAG: hypothetical protein ABIL70_08460 [candidate division WOR-3 bacterium]